MDGNNDGGDGFQMSKNLCYFLSLSLSPSPQFRRDLWGIILSGIRSGQHADKEGK